MTSRGALSKGVLPLFEFTEKSSSQLPLLSTQTTEKVTSQRGLFRSHSELETFNEVRNTRIMKEKELGMLLATARVLEQQLLEVSSPSHLSSLTLELTKSQADLGIYLRTRRELEKLKAASSSLYEKLSAYSQRVNAFKDETGSAELVVGSLRTTVSMRSLSLGEVTKKHQRALEEEGSTVKSSISLLGKRWKEKQFEENARNKRTKRMEMMKKRVSQMKNTRITLLMQMAVQEIAKREFERKMDYLQAVFGTTQAADLSYKLDFAISRGQNLQQNVDFLIVRVESLRRAAGQLRLQRELSLKLASRLSKHTLQTVNNPKVRGVEAQLAFQRQTLTDLAVMTENVETVLKGLLGKFVDKDTHGELCGRDEQGIETMGLMQVLRVFQKTVTTAGEIGVQKRALWEKRQRIAFANKLTISVLTKRSNVLLQTQPSPIIMKKSLPRLMLKTEEESNEKSDIEEDVRESQKEYKREKAAEGSTQQKTKRLKAMQVDRLKSVFEKKRDFAKELRLVDSARHQISSISRNPVLSPRSPFHDFRINSWFFVTTPIRNFE